MNWNKALTGIILSLCILIGFSLVAPGDIQTQDAAAVASSSVMAVHTFEDGVHNYSGIIDLPSPCFSLTTDIQRTDNPGEAILAFETEATATRGHCIEVIDPRPFTVKFESDQDVQIQSQVNGALVPINIISTSTKYFSTDMIQPTPQSPTSTNEQAD